MTKAAQMLEEFQTQPWEINSQLDCGSYYVQRVSFPVGDEVVVGNILIPKSDNKVPGVVVIGPIGYVKEQSPIQYAARLALKGIATLVFDPRYSGESTGEPRRYECGKARVADTLAALCNIRNHPAVEASRISLLGICQGVNWAIEAANSDGRVAALGLVAGHYLCPETAEMYVGANLTDRNARSRAARTRYEASGEVDYVPIVFEKDAALIEPAILQAEPIAQFYRPWSDRGPFWDFHGLWENRVPAMCEEALWCHDVGPHISALQTPTLMIHANRAASGPIIPRDLFSRIKATEKKLEWIGFQNQLQFYCDPLTIDNSVSKLSAWFGRTR